MDVLRKVRSLVWNERKEEIVQENIVFRLQSVWTSRIVFAAALLSTETESIGERLTCLASDQLVKLANVYCLMSNLFTVNEGHPVYLTYYQWIPFFLGLEAASFCLTQYVRNNLRGQSIGKLIRDFKKGKPDLRFIKTRSTLWVIRLYFCEILNLINLTVQIYLADIFLKGSFGLFGYKWLFQGKPFLDSVFPKRAKCTFYTFGPSGTKQVHDTLCILLHNIHNDYIFIALWFLYMSLLVLSLINALWRVISVFVTKRMYFKISLFFKLSMTPFKDYILERMSKMGCLTYCDCIFVSFALSNLSNDDLLQAVSSLSVTVDKINEPYPLDIHRIPDNCECFRGDSEPSTASPRQNPHASRPSRSLVNS